MYFLILKNVCMTNCKIIDRKIEDFKNEAKINWFYDLNLFICNMYTKLWTPALPSKNQFYFISIAANNFLETILKILEMLTSTNSLEFSFKFARKNFLNTLVECFSKYFEFPLRPGKIFHKPLGLQGYSKSFLINDQKSKDIPKKFLEFSIASSQPI